MMTRGQKWTALLCAAALAALAGFVWSISSPNVDVRVPLFGVTLFLSGLGCGWWVYRRNAPIAAGDDAELHAKVFRTIDQGASITDENGTILAVNDAFTRLTGYDAEEAIGKNPRILSSGFHDAAFYEEMWRQITAKGYWEGEVYNRRKGGEVYAEWLRISRVTGEADAATNYVGIFSDITERKATEEQLVKHAYSDALTGAANRPYLDKFLAQELSRTRRNNGCLACLFLDLDKFKPINDQYGHDAGDEVLRVFVSRIDGQLRDTDLVSRIGGDEFVVVLPDCGSADFALQVASRVLAVTSRAIRWHEESLQIGCSVGLAMYPEHARDADELIAAADKAMYRAKAAKGDSIVVAEAKAVSQRSATG